MRFLPRPVQRPLPIWVAGLYGKPRPLRRAARYQGFFPVNLEHPDQLAEIADALPRDESFDIVASLPPGVDPTPYGAAGATWWVVEIPSESATADTVRGVLRS
jgi:alkanesulfonate monooxygenase SsuD/methylene tetrahydromethanopterin reductase-like flavin-dependent oxidoreductase (luciferase family)